MEFGRKILAVLLLFFLWKVDTFARPLIGADEKNTALIMTSACLLVSCSKLLTTNYIFDFLDVTSPCSSFRQRLHLICKVSFESYLILVRSDNQFVQWQLKSAVTTVIMCSNIFWRIKSQSMKLILKLSKFGLHPSVCVLSSVSGKNLSLISNSSLFIFHKIFHSWIFSGNCMQFVLYWSFGT